MGFAGTACLQMPRSYGRVSFVSSLEVVDFGVSTYQGNILSLKGPVRPKFQSDICTIYSFPCLVSDAAVSFVDNIFRFVS